MVGNCAVEDVGGIVFSLKFTTYSLGHIGSELPKVLLKVLFLHFFGEKNFFLALFRVLLKVPELFWALFKALYFAFFWNTFL